MRLYDATSAKLFGVCLRIVKDRTEAEDAVQDAYVKIWRNAGSFREGNYSPISWLAAIARNTAIDRIRARQLAHAELDEASEVPDAQPTPEAMVIAAGEMGRIGACLEELPAERANAVKAAYVEGYSYAELAVRFGVPLNTMRTWLHRSLKSLRECLERK
jgi:RNA polymerase sigma-70 factor (ECF subfamily)